MFLILLEAAQNAASVYTQLSAEVPLHRICLAVKERGSIRFDCRIENKRNGEQTAIFEGVLDASQLTRDVGCVIRCAAEYERIIYPWLLPIRMNHNINLKVIQENPLKKPSGFSGSMGVMMACKMACLIGFTLLLSYCILYPYTCFEPDVEVLSW